MAKKQDVNLEDLKRDVATEAAQTNNFSDIDFLQETDPSDFHTENSVSSKYDKDREKEIVDGIAVIAGLGLEVNPLLLMLGKWWEVKQARAEIKKMIDAEATSLGHDKNDYLQVVLAEQVTQLAAMGEAISRIKYAKTYFKPRGTYTSKLPMKQVSIDGVVYELPLIKYNEARAEYGEKLNKADKDKIIKFVKSIGNEVSSIEEL